MGKTGRTTAELCGVAIGAGFASGRELAVFFARFGPWSWLGVGASALVMGAACWGIMRCPGTSGMPRCWEGRWQAKLWRGMFSLLMIATGGAMLSAGGELAALLPLPGCEALGLGGTLLLAWWLARRDSPALAQVSRALVAAMVLVVLSGLVLPGAPATLLVEASPWQSLPMGLCYGGFNAALAAPMMASAGETLEPHQRRWCASGFAAVTAILLCCGNGALLRHPEAIGAELPFVYLAAPMGKAGYALCASGLYLAAVTTLSACMKSLRSLLGPWMAAVTAAMALLSLSGMGTIVAVVYPVLGGLCAALLAWALWCY